MFKAMWEAVRGEREPRRGFVEEEEAFRLDDLLAQVQKAESG
jgi:hypothetical protein